MAAYNRTGGFSMRCFLLAALLPLAVWAAPGLEIVKASLSLNEDGVPDSPGFEYFQGQTLYLSCRVSGAKQGEQRNIDLKYSVQAFDPRGVPLDQIYENEVKDELLPQDKDWMPKIAAGIVVPPLVMPGEFKIVVKAQDLLAKTSTELTIPFRVRGRDVKPADTLTIRNIRFFHSETDSQTMTDPMYRVGEELWCGFDMIGYKFGPNNKVSVSYVTSILSPSGAVLWKQAAPAQADTESFYPKPYMPATMSLTTKGVKPGTYTMLVQATDSVGDQKAEARQDFRVEAARQ
jgi:hypothetical protein